jgi:hypothetical protein
MNDFEFNPKGPDLLDQQLAESGLEMSITWAGAGLLFNVGSSLAQGFMGSSAAQKANDQAQKDYEAQKLQAHNAALIQNAYQEVSFGIEKLNYQVNRQYEYANALRSWQYNESIRDFEYLQAIKEYGKSVENTADQLTYNSVAELEAREAEQAALNEIYREDAFNRQGALVDRLQSEGQAALLQSGNSSKKALQSTIASLGRNAAIMDASLSSSVEQSQRNMRSISMAKYGADLQAKASMMIKPEAMPGMTKPTITPERMFAAPMPISAAPVAKPVMQSTTAPLISGIASASKAAMGFDYSKFNQIGGQTSGNSTVKPKPTALDVGWPGNQNI